MGKKVKEFKSGDFIFAKVKGYPAWPARVQKLNGKKYFVYFYGTGEIANLAPNMIFDYAENKDKFLTKTVKRRDFNDGVKQIEYDFANNVPLEQVVGAPVEAPAADSANETLNDSAINESMDSADTTAADDTVADTTTNTTNNDTAVEDSDDPGTLIIDEGKKAKKAPPTKTPAKEPPKAPKTPRGKPKKEEQKEEKEKEEEDKPEEIVSRSGRKIRPKRYIDEQTEENTTLPTPAPKKRKATSPPPATPAQTTVTQEKDKDKNIKHFNTVTQAELEDLKEPFKPADPNAESVLIAYLPSGQYAGVKLTPRPGGKLPWDRQRAANAVALKLQLERGQITPQSVAGQLVTDLNLTDEEKAALDKERETEEKKGRVQFLKTEMKLIELDAKIKTCLSLEKADTELCLKLLDELTELEVKPLMLLKHPTCLETVKRMRAYVGNTPCWDLTENAALTFGKQAHRIRRQADGLYRAMKELFTTPDGISFWEHFSERVLHFKKVTASLTADELLEMVHEPLEMSHPSPHTVLAAVEAANETEPPLDEDEVPLKKRKEHTAKPKKTANSTPAKTPLKRQTSRKQVLEEKEDTSTKEQEKEIQKPTKQTKAQTAKLTKTQEAEKQKEKQKEVQKQKEVEKLKEVEKQKEVQKQKEVDKQKEVEKQNEIEQENGSETQIKSTNEKDEEDKAEETEKEKEQNSVEDSAQKETPSEKEDTTAQNSTEETKTDKDEPAPSAEEKKEEQSTEEKEEVKEPEKEKEKEVVDEPRAKRSRGESKKTDPPPRSPAKRKTKA